ncbi:hypothetical protein BIV60_25820 [Bacillus sp. MUM 116]|uniref:PIN domain-containing protein n=1 Tax=Bacillus sp. MUM 116 TaxID=1678002 RepID=UPI0008F5929B|nr:PIN domain-containing protein [Bacillus sp. MUM 116]OIK08629.1 hypothetical protein BIV60_25820 [Bacillus sp. MUM 116]
MQMKDSPDSSYLLDRPYGVVLDTNLLIYLFQPDVIPTTVYNKFISCLLMGRIKLIVPEQVKYEWEKHKTNKDAEYHRNAVKEIERHRILSNYMEGEKEKVSFNAQIDLLVKMAARNYRYNFGIRARNLSEHIEDPHLTTIPKRNHDVDSIVVEMSLNKRAPFFGPDDENLKDKTNKNEMADAVIFFTAYDFIKNHKGTFEKVYFITVNKNDFCKKGDDSRLHPNLQPYADEIGMVYYNNLERLLKEVDPKEHYNLEFYAQNSSIYLSDKYFEKCPKCEGEVHKMVIAGILLQN